MDSTYIISLGSALWLGILTSISPCPLATNIAAVSYIGRNIDSKLTSVLSGLFYAIGRVIVYMGISIMVIGALAQVPALSMFLQTKVNLVLGPLLFITGLILLDIIKLSFGNNNHSKKAEKLAKKRPILGSILIGALFALAFCPVSAALFFGSMLPIAIKHQSTFIIPSLYGLGTALPVIGFAVIIATGANYIGTVFNKLTQLEIWGRRVTGIIFITVGVYFTITFLIKI